MIVTTICFILIVHFIADFLFQTREMAINKSSSLKWLSLHVLTYTLVLGGLCGMITFQSFNDYVIWVFLNGVIHWITDFITSKLTTYYYKKNNMAVFWNIIGADQLAHTLTLLITSNYFLL